MLLRLLKTPDILGDHVSVYHYSMMELLLNHMSEPLMNNAELGNIVRGASAAAGAHRIGQTCWKWSDRGGKGLEPELGNHEESKAVEDPKAVGDAARVLPTFIDP